jgi:hypothetical protein
VPSGPDVPIPPVHVERNESIYAPTPVSLSIELDTRGCVKSIYGDTPDPAAVGDAARYKTPALPLFSGSPRRDSRGLSGTSTAAQPVGGVEFGGAPAAPARKVT